MRYLRFLVIALVFHQGAAWHRLVGSGITSHDLDPATDDPVSKDSDLNCDFDDSCCWSNANSSVDDLNWVLLKGNPSSHKFKKTFGTSRVPSGNFLGVRGDSSSSDDKAILYSCPIPCADGDIKVSLRHWQTDDVDIEVCLFHDQSCKPRDCQDFSDSSGKRESVTLPGGNNKRLVIMASDLSSDDVALIDSVTVDYDSCSGGVDNGDGEILTPKENYYCVADSDRCTPDVSKCCEDTSACQKDSSDGVYRCSPINKGISNCGVHPLITKCDYNAYDTTMPPGMALDGSSTLVYLKVTLRNIIKNAETGLYMLDMIIREYWNDIRLAHNENRLVLYRKQEHFDRIWLPDIYFPTAVESYKQQWLTPPHSLRIYQDGFIRLSQRIQIVTACDSKCCVVHFESYGTVRAFMDLAWTTPDVTINIDSSISSIVTGASSDTCTRDSGNSNGRDYPCLRATFKLKN